MSGTKAQNFELAAYEEAYLDAIVDYWNEAFREKHNFWPITAASFWTGRDRSTVHTR